MDHVQALNIKASERYLLGEMSEPERFAFEEHYFDCTECAQDVRIGSALAQGVRSICAADAHRPARVAAAPDRRSRWAWLSPAFLAPAMALLVLGCVTGYQSFVTIPALESPIATSAVVLRAAARGDEQTIEVRRHEPYAVLSLDVNAADPGTPLVYEIASEKRVVSATGNAVAPPPGSPLLIVLRQGKLDRPGPWQLVLRTPQGAEIARYPFSIQFK